MSGNLHYRKASNVESRLTKEFMGPRLKITMHNKGEVSKMNHFKKIGWIFLIACAVLTMPMIVSAQVIEYYTPMEHDFGDVEIGETQSQIFTIKITYDGPYFLADITLVADNSEYPPLYTGNSFVITRQPDDPFIPPGEYFEVEVTFSPASLGPHQAYLRIESDESTGLDDLRIPLFGIGVPAEPEPVEEMAELIDFFDTSVTDGFIIGCGPGESADRRLKAFSNILKSANDLINSGFYQNACEALRVAAEKCDGVHPPPDFITGDNRQAINESIAQVRNLLGCL
jgi:hypothetical protein